MNADALRALDVELVLVFGSRARGDARPDSDTDVGVLFAPGARDRRGRLEDVRDALDGTDDLDLAVLDDADPLLAREAALEGRVEFEAYDGAAEEFRVRACTLYMDTEWLRQIESDALRKRYG